MDADPLTLMRGRNSRKVCFAGNIRRAELHDFGPHREPKVDRLCNDLCLAVQSVKKMLPLRCVDLFEGACSAKQVPIQRRHIGAKVREGALATLQVLVRASAGTPWRSQTTIRTKLPCCLSVLSSRTPVR